MAASRERARLLQLRAKGHDIPDAQPDRAMEQKRPLSSVSTPQRLPHDDCARLTGTAVPGGEAVDEIILIREYCSSTPCSSASPRSGPIKLLRTDGEIVETVGPCDFNRWRGSPKASPELRRCVKGGPCTEAP
ncbi:MAG: hypothetical protein AAFR52_07630 [Pseudomonadota bacterium]